jgi:hypothetical protein
MLSPETEKNLFVLAKGHVMIKSTYSKLDLRQFKKRLTG